jgi:hypothetical protein
MSKQIQDAYIVAATRLPVAVARACWATFVRTTCWRTPSGR